MEIMRKLIRRWLGIEKIELDSIKTLTILCKAIDETFNLKKNDKSIQCKMMHIIIRELGYNQNGKNN